MSSFRSRPTPPRVKVCGLTNAEDALLALDAGADALGFVFHASSPRSIDRTAWQAIRNRLPPWSHCLAVFAAGDEPMIPGVLAEGGFAGFQLHGASPGEVSAFPGMEFFRAFDPDQDSLDQADHFLAQGRCRGILLDPRRGDLSGGTGSPASPSNCRSWLTHFPHAVLAGGLGPENILQVIEDLQPRAVDASSKLEREPGKKDPEKLRAFVRTAKGAHGERY